MCFQEKRMNDIFKGILPKNPTKKEKEFLEFAKHQAIQKGSMRARHCAIIVKNNKTIGIGVNVNLHYVTNTGAMSYHSEYICFQSINIRRIQGAVLYIVRIERNINETFMNSAPCHRCFCLISKFLKNNNISKVIFSMPNGKIHSFTKYDL
jgi:deoxycytidylate deaminase